MHIALNPIRHRVEGILSVYNFTVCILMRGGIYTVKYSLSPREIPREEAIFHSKSFQMMEYWDFTLLILPLSKGCISQ